MVPLGLLFILAVLLFLCAGAVARLRRLGRPRVTRDGAVALVAGAVSVVFGICCYAAGFRNAGAACFLVFPAVAAVLLKVMARSGSAAGAFLVSVVAVVLVGAWVILHLKGPRGGWGASEVFVFASGVVLTYGAAACIGWWCGRS